LSGETCSAPRRTSDFARLFPAEVRSAAAEVQADDRGLHAAERARVARAVQKRRNEFATGRVLARRLLEPLGVRDWTLLPDDDRAPRWPDAIVGSISHGGGLCVVAVAPRGAIVGLGVDVESDEAVSPALFPRVLGPAEHAWLLARPEPQRRALATVFFSAKEAVYKAQFPLTRARLGFADVELVLDPARASFAARVPGFARAIAGAWAVEQRRVIAAVTLFAQDARS
jgi:4'-phosphopantetheinyl transferase EntD